MKTAKTKLPKKMVKKVASKTTKRSIVRLPKAKSLKLPHLYLGPIVAILMIGVILVTARLLTPTNIVHAPAFDPQDATPENVQTGTLEPKAPELNLQVSSPTGWEKFDNSLTPEPTQTFYLDKVGSSLHLGSRFALHSSGDICGGEAPCVEYGTFNTEVAGKTFTTPLFLSKNRVTGQTKYIFQFRLYGFEGANYVSAKVADEKQLEAIRTFLSTMTLN